MPNDIRSLHLDTAIQQYFDVLYTCDLALFDRLFHPSCQLFTVVDGKESVLSAQAYRDILSKRESPQTQGAPREETLQGIQALSPDIALVQVRVRVGAKVFRDHLHFIHVQGQWRLAAKLYTLEAGA